MPRVVAWFCLWLLSLMAMFIYLYVCLFHLVSNVLFWFGLWFFFVIFLSSFCFVCFYCLFSYLWNIWWEIKIPNVWLSALRFYKWSWYSSLFPFILRLVLVIWYGPQIVKKDEKSFPPNILDHNIGVWIEIWKYFERILLNHELYWWRIYIYIYIYFKLE